MLLTAMSRGGPACRAVSTAVWQIAMSYFVCGVSQCQGSDHQGHTARWMSPPPHPHPIPSRLILLSNVSNWQQLNVLFLRFMWLCVCSFVSKISIYNFMVYTGDQLDEHFVCLVASHWEGSRYHVTVIYDLSSIVPYNSIRPIYRWWWWWWW